MDFANNLGGNQFGGTGMQYNAYNQFGQPVVRNNILTSDEINQLMKKDNAFSLAMSETDILRANCTHRTADGMRDALVEDPVDGSVQCSICGYKFRPLSETTSVEAIKEAVSQVIDILQTIKLLWVDINSDAAREFFPITGLLEKVPSLFELAAKDFAKHGNLNPWSYNNSNMSAVALFQTLSGIINGNYQASPQMMGGMGYQQPGAMPNGMMGGMGYQQPPTPFGMPVSNGFGYVGGGYMPTTDSNGFQTTYGAPQQQAPVQQPVADQNVTANAATTKA